MNHTFFARSVRIAIALSPLFTLLAAARLSAQPRRPDKKAAPCASPFVAIASAQDTAYWLDVAPFTMPVTIGPAETAKEISGGGRLLPIDPYRHLYSIRIDQPMPGATEIIVRASSCGKVYDDRIILSVDKPWLRNARFDKNNSARMVASGIDQWAALQAFVGEVYDPSSDWANATIPENHYRTVVTIKGHEALNRDGVTFHNLPADLQRALTVREDYMPEDIVTRVYWKPGGTPDQSRWVLLLCNQPDPRAVIPLEAKRMDVELARPSPPAATVEASPREFTVPLSEASPTWRGPTMALAQREGGREIAPVQVGAQCYDCVDYGLDVALERVDDAGWRLRVDATNMITARAMADSLAAKKIPVTLILEGKHGTTHETIRLAIELMR